MFRGSLPQRSRCKPEGSFHPKKSSKIAELKNCQLWVPGFGICFLWALCVPTGVPTQPIHLPPERLVSKKQISSVTGSRQQLGPRSSSLPTTIQPDFSRSRQGSIWVPKPAKSPAYGLPVGCWAAESMTLLCNRIVKRIKLEIASGALSCFVCVS